MVQATANSINSKLTKGFVTPSQFTHRVLTTTCSARRNLAAARRNLAAALTSATPTSFGTSTPTSSVSIANVTMFLSYVISVPVKTFGIDSDAISGKKILKGLYNFAANIVYIYVY